MSQITPEAFITNLRTWVGTPWHHQQHTRYGCDCIGLFIGCYLELGIDYTATNLKSRSRYPQGRKLLGRVEEICGPAIESPEPICLLVFCNNPEKLREDHASHVACYTENGTIIHAVVEEKVIETDYTEALQKHFLAAYRLPMG